MASNSNESSNDAEKRKQKEEEDRKKTNERGQKLDIFVYAVDIVRSIFGL